VDVAEEHELAIDLPAVHARVLVGLLRSHWQTIANCVAAHLHAIPPCTGEDGFVYYMYRGVATRRGACSCNCGHRRGYVIMILVPVEGYSGFRVLPEHSVQPRPPPPPAVTAAPAARTFIA